MFKRDEVPKYIYRESKRDEVPEYIYRESKRDEVPEYIYREFKRDFVPLLIFPLPLSREGGKGGGFPNRNKNLKQVRSINNLYDIS